LPNLNRAYRAEPKSEAVSVSPRDNSIWPQCGSARGLDAEVEGQISGLLDQMSMAQKIGQMMQPEIRHVSPEEVGAYHIGSVLNGGGSFPNNNKHAGISAWVALADEFYDASMRPADGHVPVPVIWGVDAVHGHNNVYGATVFPHNVGLGAANNPDLIYRIAQITAAEVAATGIDWSFAPTLAVVRDDRWGRGYESYSESPDIVKAYAEKMVLGLQGEHETFLGKGRVLATAKHYLGDGGTEDGIDQGDNIASEVELRDIHAQGYFTALGAGVQTVMATFNSWKGEKVHGHYYLITEVLKEQMGFDGLVVSDWNGFKQVERADQLSCKNCINAGVDMIMAPEDWKPLIGVTLAQVARGEIEESRINDAVRRILRVKFRAGLFAGGRPSERLESASRSVVGSAAHREIARDAVRQSLVLLKNENRLLPLSPRQKVLVAGAGADNITQQCGGWTLTWQGTDNSNSDFPGATSIYSGIQSVVTNAGGRVELSVDGSFDDPPDVAIVVFGEEPYAEGEGDRTHLSYSADSPEDLAVLRRLSTAGIPVVVVFLTGRPMWVNPELNSSDAFVVAWLPGGEGGGVAEVLFKDQQGNIVSDFVGRLACSWPADALQTNCNRDDQVYNPLYPYGFGLNYSASDLELKFEPLSEVDSARELDTSAGVRIYDRRPIAPFRLYVGEQDNWKQPVVANDFLSAAGGMHVEAVDRLLQEDARRCSWSGNFAGQLFLQAPYSVDLSGLSDLDAELTMQIRLETRPTGEVRVRMDSGYPSVGEIDGDDLFRGLPLGQWAPVSFKLHQFKAAGVDLSAIDTPLLVWSDGVLVFSIADVRIQLPG